MKAFPRLGSVPIVKLFIIWSTCGKHVAAQSKIVNKQESILEMYLIRQDSFFLCISPFDNINAHKILPLPQMTTVSDPLLY